MAAVDGETPACLTRMAEKAIVSAPAMAIARGRAARAVTTAGMAGAAVEAKRSGRDGQAPRRERPRPQRAAAAQRRRRRPALGPVAHMAPAERAGHRAAAADLQRAVGGAAHVHGARDRTLAGGQRPADAQAGHEDVAAHAQAALEARLAREAPAAQSAA